MSTEAMLAVRAALSHEDAEACDGVAQMLESALCALPGGISGESAQRLLAEIPVAGSPARAARGLAAVISVPDLPQFVSECVMHSDTHSNWLIRILGHLAFASAHFVRYPEALDWLLLKGGICEGRSWPDYRSAVSEIIGFATPVGETGVVSHDSGKTEPMSLADARELLVKFRIRETIRIAARDLLGLASTEESARELSDLAQAILSAATVVCTNALKERFGIPWIADGPSTAGGPCGFAVLGMGKLGGRELNFSSDVDLIFLYEAEGDTRIEGEAGEAKTSSRLRSISNHEFYVRLSESLIQFVGQRDWVGMLYRVDMRLRPEGVTGPLARSFESFLSYLKEQARDWEKLAYLKARVLTAPANFAERLYRATQRFVFADVDPPRLISEIETLKARIDHEVATGEQYQRDIKRGFGGIREIEFVVAAMQIVSGGAHPALRIRNTFLAIQRLQEVGLIDLETARNYQQAYALLRQVEHRLQMIEDAQTHELPNTENGWRCLARTLDSASVGDSLAFFRAQLQQTRQFVHDEFRKYFGSPPDNLAEIASLLRVLDAEVPLAEAAKGLAPYGLGTIEDVTFLRALGRGTRDIYVTAEAQRNFEQFLPALVRIAAETPKPTRVLLHLHSLMLAIKSITYYYELLSQNPQILRLLATLFGHSDRLAEAFVANPGFLDLMLSSRVVTASLDQELLPMIRLVPGRSSLSARLLQLRRHATFAQIALVMRLLLGHETVMGTLRDNARVHDALFSNALETSAKKYAEVLAARRDDGVAVAEIERDISATLVPCFTVVALGKYGGQELGLFGDLDVVFVFDEPDSTAIHEQTLGGISFSEHMNGLAEALLFVFGENLPGGRAAEVDTRLRPHGRNAPQIVSRAALRDYLLAEAEVWELLAWSRARTVLGMSAVADSVRECLSHRMRSYPMAQFVSEIRAMRGRLEETVPSEQRDVDFKRAPGGVVDIEFAVQAMALRQREQTANDDFEGLPMDLWLRANMLREPAMGFAHEAYTMLRSLETYARIFSGGSNNVWPAHADFSHLARNRQLGDRAELNDLKANVRKWFENVLHELAGT